MEKKDKKTNVEDRLNDCEKFIAIGNGGVLIWKGFASIYELLGFIDIEIKQNEIKNTVVESFKNHKK